jgi:uncharacterized protein (TIGR02284 family)
LKWPGIGFIVEKHIIMNWSEEIKSLNDLHELLADGRKGYQEAAERLRAEDAAVASHLEKLSDRRRALQDALAMEIQSFRRDDRLKDGTAKGDLHRAWMDIRSAIGRVEAKDMLEECERGEKYLIDRYNEVLSDPKIEAGSKELLAAQRGQVQTDLAELQSLKANAGAAHSKAH